MPSDQLVGFLEIVVRAGLIAVQRGPGGASLARPAESITLRDVWRAIHPEKEALLRVHGRTNAACAVGRQVPELLRRRFAQTEQAMMDDLSRTTLADLVASLRRDERDERQAARA